MFSASQHADFNRGDAGSSTQDKLQLLQRLQTLELQVDLDAQSIAQLREQNSVLEDALSLERARGEKQAEALMHIARTCDDRVDELKAQHAAAIAKLENEKAALNAAHATAFAKLRGKACLEAQVAVSQAQTTSKLTDIHCAVRALHTLLPPVSPLIALARVAFDRDWCSAACGTTWKVDIDTATGTRVQVTNKQADHCWLTLRSSTPLPRRLAPALVADGRKQHRLPAYRVVIETYNPGQVCHLGFVPSHNLPFDGTGAAVAVTPIANRIVWEYGGWYIQVRASCEGAVRDAPCSGWTVLEPASGAARGNAAGLDTSAYATTSKVPPLPAGSAVGFAVDYAAGTCRVAFYTPAAVAGGFVQEPYAKMELRFVATEANESNKILARPVPTAADSHVELYPAVSTPLPGTVWRFVS
jgi:hypothetical protein